MKGGRARRTPLHGQESFQDQERSRQGTPAIKISKRKSDSHCKFCNDWMSHLNPQKRTNKGRTTGARCKPGKVFFPQKIHSQKIYSKPGRPLLRPSQGLRSLSFLTRRLLASPETSACLSCDSCSCTRSLDIEMWMSLTLQGLALVEVEGWSGGAATFSPPQDCSGNFSHSPKPCSAMHQNYSPSNSTTISFIPVDWRKWWDISSLQKFAEKFLCPEK